MSLFNLSNKKEKEMDNYKDYDYGNLSDDDVVNCIFGKEMTVREHKKKMGEVIRGACEDQLKILRS